METIMLNQGYLSNYFTPTLLCYKSFFGSVESVRKNYNEYALKLFLIKTNLRRHNQYTFSRFFDKFFDNI